nr:unnamed protein product [Callosobruchus analis]
MSFPLIFYVFFGFQGVFSYSVVTSDASIIGYGELFEKVESRLKTDLKPFVERLGYKLEKVPVTTKDGYILELHHVYLNPSTNPVLIMPGLMSSSADFLITGKDRSLAMRLADQGYDVWIGNSRGTTYSRKHKTLNPDEDKEKFWDFSFHELGYYDLPACVDYILDRTKAKTLSYIGHSEGATQYFVMASTRSEYNSKINVMVALAPVAFMTHSVQPILKFIDHHIVLVEWIQKQLDVYEFFKHYPIITIAGKLFCRPGSKYQWVCELFYSLFQGYDVAELDKNLLPTILENYPAGCSIKQLKHYIQEIDSGHFRQYDYGVLRNLEVYNQSNPPDYDISKVTCPVALLYGTNDRNTAPKDVEALANSLPNLVKLHKIEKPTFNRADFIFAKDSDALVNFVVINILNGYNGKPPITTPTTSVPTRAPSTKRPTSGPRTTERGYTAQPFGPTSVIPPPSGSASQLFVGSKILVILLITSKIINLLQRLAVMTRLLLFCAFLSFQTVRPYKIITPETTYNPNGDIFEELASSLKTNLKPFVERRGYKFERVPVTTDDGYILELHHVYLNTSTNPVLIMPGLMSSSADFLITDKNRSLAMRLADQGYDVWIGNNRGTTYSRKHKSLNPDKDREQFWDFSFHELGYYDSPACVDYILSRTNAKSLSYIGHSQGTTQYFAMASTRPEYNSKINVMVALAPVAFMTHVRQPAIQILKHHIILVEWLQKHLHVYEFFRHHWLMTLAGKLLCRQGSPIQWYCGLLYSSLQGFDIGQLDMVTKRTPFFNV